MTNTLKSVHIFNKFQHVKCISKSQTYLYHNIKLVLFHLISMADDKTLALRLYFPQRVTYSVHQAVDKLE
jgi:hypothetical protein